MRRFERIHRPDKLTQFDRLFSHAFMVPTSVVLVANKVDMAGNSWEGNETDVGRNGAKREGGAPVASGESGGDRGGQRGDSQQQRQGRGVLASTSKRDDDLRGGNSRQRAVRVVASNR